MAEATPDHGLCGILAEMANRPVAQHQELRTAARGIRDHYPGARVILFGSSARADSFGSWGQL